MMKNTSEWERPVFFRRNRVFRVYRGGKLFSDFLGDKPEDGNEPEEWICSSVRAINPGHTDPYEGISLRMEDGKPLNELLQEHPGELLGERKDLGVLVKFLDSAIRLPMQVHPTRAFSKENFGSPYGKAEAWLILATRPDACIYFGFHTEVTKAEFTAAVDESERDPDTMTRLVNRIPVKTGDVFFVSAGMIHAIGAGCMILEVQEPTDFTIQPEHWCGEYHLNAREMYLGLEPQIALDCFDFTRFGEQAAQQGRKQPRVLHDDGVVRSESLIDENDTPCFSMQRHTLHGGALRMQTPASVWICVGGNGELCGEDYRRAIKTGDYFLLPAAAAGKIIVKAEKELQIICCAGGK